MFTTMSRRLRVVIDGKRGKYSETVSALTPSTTPSAPALPKVTQKTKTSLLLKWSVCIHLNRFCQITAFCPSTLRYFLVNCIAF